MNKWSTYLLVTLALMAGAAVMACGGNATQKVNPLLSTPPTVAVHQGPPESIGGIDFYPGSTQITSGSWLGSEATVPGFWGRPPASDYATIQYAVYRTTDPAMKVLDWYNVHMAGWKKHTEVRPSDIGGYSVWLKDETKEAAWIDAGENAARTLTTISIYYGSQGE